MLFRSQEATAKEGLEVVSRPNIVDLHFHDGQPLKFKAEFEVAPTIELGQYKGLEVEYAEPVVSDDDVNLVSTLVFLGFGGHIIMISMVLESFKAVPIGQSILGQVAFGKVVAWSSMIFLGGVLIALPVMVSLLFINIGMGVITRAAPSLNIFSVGLPASIAAGFLVLILAMDSIVGRIQWLWMQAFNHARDLVGLVS